MQRHTRAHARFHTERIVKKRRAKYLREAWWWRDDEWLKKRLSYGRLAKMDPWDCGKARCGVCRDTWSGNKRTREKREWQKIVEAAY